MFGLFQQKNQEEVKEDQRVKIKLEKIKNAKQEEKHRAPNPCKVKFPEENFIEFTVVQDTNVIQLQTYRFSPPSNIKPRAILFLFHGLCAHMNHGAHIAEAVVNLGCVVVGFDHRGFGKSQGHRGYLESVGLHLQDSVEFINKVLLYYKDQGIVDLPIFLSGLSMGGMTSFRISVQKSFPIRGIIMFAPAIRIMQSKTTIQMAKVVGNLFPKTKSSLMKQKKGQTTKNPQISDEMQADPHTYTAELLPGTAKTILTAMEESQEMYHKLETPWLLIMGDTDKLVDPDVAIHLYEKSPAKDKEVMFYEGLWHDIWHEQEIMEILPRVVKWMESRI